MIRVLVVDDHPLMREGLTATLADEPDVEVVGEAGNAEDGLELASSKQPDVVVVDVKLPGRSGVDLIADLRRCWPLQRALAMTGSPTNRVMEEVFDAGADGFVVKTADATVLLGAIRAVADGGTWIDPSVAPRMVAAWSRQRRSQSGPHGLTEREQRVLEQLTRGLTNREIGQELHITPHTVKSHLRNAMRKLGAHDRTEAAAIAIEEGLA